MSMSPLTHADNPDDLNPTAPRQGNLETTQGVLVILAQSPDGSRDLFRDRFAHGEGLPKNDVADHVASQGLRVPRRYATFDDAVREPGQIIIRSEDPREYAGMSGIYESPRVTCETRDINSLLPIRACMDIADDLIAQYNADTTLPSYTPEGGHPDVLSLDQRFFTTNPAENWKTCIICQCIDIYFRNDRISQDLPIEIKIHDRSDADAKMPTQETIQDSDIKLLSTNTLPPGWTSASIIEYLGGRDMYILDMAYSQKVPGKKLSFYNSEGGMGEISGGWDAIEDRLKADERSRANNDRIDIGDTLGALKYSFWEYIPGRNLAVCRDDTDPDIYYVYRQGDSIKNRALSCTGIGNNTPYGCRRIEKNSRKYREYRTYIEFYERIARLPAFDTTNSPIIEMQESKEDETLYFLQYLPTHSRGEGWKLERPIERGEIEVDCVRGATGPEGIEILLAEYDDSTMSTWKGHGFVMSTGDLRVTGEVRKIAHTIERRCTECRVAMVYYPEDLDLGYREHLHITDWLIGDHGGRSVMHKPQVTLLLSHSKFRDLGIVYCSDNPVRVQVISDGKRCFIKKLSGG